MLGSPEGASQNSRAVPGGYRRGLKTIAQWCRENRHRKTADQQALSSTPKSTSILPLRRHVPHDEGGMPTRNGRILLSFGNWIAVCADHSSRQGIRRRMPDFHLPSISEFSTFDRRFANTASVCPFRAGPASNGPGLQNPLVGRDDFWARHDAGPALGASETGRFTLVYICFEFLQGSARKCQKVQPLRRVFTAQHAICKSHKSGYIGGAPCVFQRVKNLAPPDPPKLAR
jgi:hypothetical protein